MEHQYSSHEAITAIKLSLLKTDWWKYVHEDVKIAIELIINNLPSLGLLFRDTFISSFKYTHATRLIKGEALQSDKPGALFGRKLTEECYRSALLSTKLLLDLDDWIIPNDADVQACMQICQHIDTLEQLGVLKANTEQSEKDFLLD